MMSTEVRSDWWERLQALWWPEDRIRPTEARRQYYQAKRDVVEEIQPHFIAEIGVRAGYSAWAMLDAAGPDCRFWGIDLDEGTHGGDPGAFQHAEVILAPWSPELVTGYSRRQSELPEGIDLLHIDGDHTFEACYGDMALGERSGVQWMLVDDFDYIHDVARAVNRFCRPLRRVPQVIHDGHRGMALLDMRWL
jgi:hypothetical protein